MQTQTLKGVFTFIHLKLKVFKKVLIEDQNLRGGPSRIACDITNALEVNPGPICNLYKRDVET